MSSFYNIIYKALQAFTSYDVIFGGNSLVADFNKGAVVITMLRQKSLTRSDRNYKDFVDGEISQSSIQQLDFQCDVMRINPQNHAGIEAYAEALQIKEFLKGYEISEALASVECYMLPFVNDISFFNEFNDSKQLINRAAFEFSLINKETITQKADKITKAKAEINNILQGE